MSTQRLHLPIGRELLEMLRRSAIVGAIMDLLHLRLLPPPVADTSIAWEDGEAADDPQRRG